MKEIVKETKIEETFDAVKAKNKGSCIALVVDDKGYVFRKPTWAEYNHFQHKVIMAEKTKSKEPITGDVKALLSQVCIYGNFIELSENSPAAVMNIFGAVQKLSGSEVQIEFC